MELAVAIDFHYDGDDDDGGGDYVGVAVDQQRPEFGLALTSLTLCYYIMCITSWVYERLR